MSSESNCLYDSQNYLPISKSMMYFRSVSTGRHGQQFCFTVLIVNHNYSSNVCQITRLLYSHKEVLYVSLRYVGDIRKY